MAGDIEVEVEFPDLRHVLAYVKEFSPKMATDLRRELRHSGDEIIAGQRRILTGPKPGSVRVSGKKLTMIHPKGRHPYFAFRNQFAFGGESAGTGQNTRAAIADNLATRIKTGKTSQSISLQTQVKKAPLSIVWQKRLFRHPVFARGGASLGSSRGAWVYQQGQPYFWDPVSKGYVVVRRRVAEAVDAALARINSTT